MPGPEEALRNHQDGNQFMVIKIQGVDDDDDQGDHHDDDHDGLADHSVDVDDQDDDDEDKKFPPAF